MARVGGAKFRRQVPIGPYVADFLCVEARLIVELEGPPHDDIEQRQHDEVRDAWLRAEGFRISRFSNDLAIAGTELLVQAIERALAEAARVAPSSVGLRPTLSPARGEGEP